MLTSTSANIRTCLQIATLNTLAFRKASAIVADKDLSDLAFSQGSDELTERDFTGRGANKREPIL